MSDTIPSEPEADEKTDLTHGDSTSDPSPNLTDEDSAPETTPSSSESPAEREPNSTDDGSTPESSPPPATVEPASESTQSSPPAVTVQSSAPGGKPNHRLLKILLILVLLVLVIAGATVAAKHFMNSNSQTSATTKKDIPLLTWGATAGEVPQYPITYLGVSVDDDIEAQLFEGLTGYQDQTKVVPLLATSWSNPNDTTWVFNLRHGVKFHTGRTMTAQDVKYSLDYAVAHQNDNDGNTSFSVANTIKQVDVTNPYQVRITTDGPDPVLLNRLDFIGIIDSQAKLGDYNAGTGPYIVKPGTTPTASSIDLVASNNYWGGHVYTREVKLTIDSSADQLAADTAAGKFDLAGDLDVSQLAKIKHYQPVSVPDQGLNYIGLDTEKAGSPLQSVTARQAVAYALNVPAILKAGGLQGQQASQLVPLLLPGHDPSITNTPYNPTKAKQLLASVPNAATQLTFAYPSGDDPQALEMVKELDAVGFNVKPIVVADFGTFVTDTNAGKYDLFTLGDTSNTVDGLSIINDLLEGVQYYDNPQVDTLVSQASSTLDPTTRINEMQKIAQIVNTDKPIIPLYTQTRIYALTKPSYVMTPDMPSLSASVYFWKVYQK